MQIDDGLDSKHVLEGHFLVTLVDSSNAPPESQMGNIKNVCKMSTQEETFCGFSSLIPALKVAPILICKNVMAECTSEKPNDMNNVSSEVYHCYQ